MKSRSLSMALVVALTAQGGWAAADGDSRAPTIPYSAELDAERGGWLPDGEYPAVFTFWSEAVGGEFLWEHRATAEVARGRVSARLPVEGLGDVDLSGAWLEVEVAGLSVGLRTAHDFPLAAVLDGRLQSTQVQFPGPTYDARIGAPFGSLTISMEHGDLHLKTSNLSAPISRIEIKKEGLVAIQGVAGPVDVDLTNPESGFLLLGRTNFPNIVIDDNEIMARNNGATSTLFLQHQGGAVYVNGMVAHASDARLKDDIRDLDKGLDEVLRLRPVSFFWKREPSRAQMGLVAQEVRDVVEEVMVEDDDGMLGIAYSQLVPLLIHAIQQQEARIAALERELAALPGALAAR